MTNARATRESRQAKAAAMRAAAAKAEARRRQMIVGAVALVLIALVIAIFAIVQTSKHNNAKNAGSTPGGFDGNYSVVVGQASAPVTVIAYEDFQCPACQQYEKANRAQLAAYVKAGSIKIDYRPIAILDRSSSTNYSTRALNAAAAVVTNSPSAFVTFHDLLYDNQPAEGTAGLKDQQLIDYAVQAGAPKAAVTAAVTKEIYKGWTVKATDEATTKGGVSGTPTVKVNGKTLTDVSAASVKSTIDAAIAAAKK